MKRFYRTFSLLVASGALALMLAAGGALTSLRASAEDDFPGQARPVAPMTSGATGMKLVWIRAGAFEMGSNSSEEGHTRSELQHIVRITRPFYMSVHEVTQGDYSAVMETNPSAFAKTGTAAAEVADMDTSRFPVENVSWFDAIEFCNQLSVKDELKPYYGLANIVREEGSIKSAVVTTAGGSGYRLPTEAEWEYACRAGTTTSYHSGDTVKQLGRAGWFGGSDTSAGNSENQPHRVGLKSANDFGLFDMHGNVAEWCQDWYDYSAYERSPTNDPPGPGGGSLRLLRGGDWDDPAVDCRSACRGASAPAKGRPDAGFRVVRSVQVSRPQKPQGVPPFRIVIDLRDGGTVDVFNGESYDSVDSAKERLFGSKLFGRLDNIRIIDSEGNQFD